MTLYEKIEQDFIRNANLNLMATFHAFIMFGRKSYLKHLFAKDTNLQREVAKRMLATNNLTYKEYAQFIGELNERETNREEQ